MSCVTHLSCYGVKLALRMKVASFRQTFRLSCTQCHWTGNEPRHVWFARHTANLFANFWLCVIGNDTDKRLLVFYSALRARPQTTWLIRFQNLEASLFLWTQPFSWGKGNAERTLPWIDQLVRDSALHPGSLSICHSSFGLQVGLSWFQQAIVKSGDDKFLVASLFGDINAFLAWLILGMWNSSLPMHLQLIFIKPLTEFTLYES